MKGQISVIGRRWDSNSTRHALTTPGRHVEDILLEAVQAMRREGAGAGYARRVLRQCRCRVNGVDLPRHCWQSHYPQAGDRLEFLLAPLGGGGGGGGKNPMATVLSLAVVVAAMTVPFLAPASWGLATGALFAGGSLTALGGVVSAGIMLLGGFAVNALFPTAKPSLGSYGGATELEKESQVYSINGSQNAANPFGFVPLVLGRHKHTPPLAAKSWTVWEGDVQYFNMLVCWGHSDISVTDFKIGDTPLDDYKLVTHKFHQSTTGSGLKYFAKTYNENSVGALIQQADGWTTRTVGEAEDISIDIAFQGGLCTINEKNGAIEVRAVEFEIQYKATSSGTWLPFRSHAVEYVDGAQTKSLVKNFRHSGLERDEYEVRVRRITEDSTSQYVRDEATWTTMRAILNERAFSTPVPVCISELRIQASEQLSGYVSDFNAICQSVIPDYDAASGTWVTRATSNPASCLRYLLTSRHGLNSPYGAAKLDDASLAGWHDFCRVEGFAFNFICDTEETLWNRLTQIAAAGRAGVTLDNDGLYGVAIDRAGLTPVQIFTPRNSWGLTINREFFKLPHALRVKFVNEDNGWNQDEGFVYADGYSKATATDIIEWDFPGKTRWSEVWRHGRYYLARTKLRPISLTLSTDWEWRLCRRGQVVGVASDVLMNVFGTARVQRLAYVVDGKTVWIGREADMPAGLVPVGVELDDSIDFSEPAPARYGISIRNSAGRPIVYEIQPQYGQVSSRLLFAHTITAAQAPALQALATVSILGDEYAEYMVASIAPGENASAELTLIPYAPEIMDADSGEIPEWEPPIHLDVTRGKKLPVPSIVRIVSDESMLALMGSTIVVQMGVYWKLRASTAEAFDVQAKADDGRGSILFGYADMSSPYVPVPNVSEGVTYSVRVRLVGKSGKVSDWSAPVSHTVVGKTLPPPDVTGFTARIDNPRGVLLQWDAVQVLDLAKYSITGAYSIETIDTSVTVPAYNQLGLLTYYNVAVDTGGRVSRNKAAASVTVEPPKNVDITSAQLLDEGIVLQWNDAKTTWDLAGYEVISGQGYAFWPGTVRRGTLPVSGKFSVNQSALMRAKDIFNNWSAEQTSRIITIYPPKTPQVKLGYNKLNGNITLEWQDCQNDEVEGAPRLDHYEITGTLSNNSVVSVKGTYYESVIPLQVYEMGTREEGGILVNVGTVTVLVKAVDKYGITNQDRPDYKDNAVQLSIYPPYNPTDFGVSATLADDVLDAAWTEGASIVLNWRDCERTFAIDYYTVYDSYTRTTYKVGSNYVVLQARPEGSYALTVQAFDVLGQSSAAMQYNLRIGGVGGMTVEARIDGSDVLLEWDTPSSSFNIDHYIIIADNDTLPDGSNDDLLIEGYLGQAKSNFFRIPAGTAGSYTYYVWAVDVAGNVSADFASYATVEIKAPQAPSVLAALSGDGVGVQWQAEYPENTLPIIAWDVRRYDGAVTPSTIANYTPLADYGRLDVDRTTVPAFAVGSYAFAVRGIDSGGNVGPWGLGAFTARAPGRVTFSDPVVIDNNVQLYWTPPDVIFFPVREYIFAEVEDGYSMEIGRVDALFASETEYVAGQYVYSITPVDVGGNLGTPTSIACRVSQPPNFVFYDKVDSLFNGEKTNMVLDGAGHMLGPVLTGETWIENIARIKQLDGVDVVTHQDKVNLGYTVWPEPFTNLTGQYVEVVDHGSLVASSNIFVTVTHRVIDGSPAIACMIEVSQDNVDWTLISDNATSVYATQFRYTRVTLTITGGTVEISHIFINLNKKQVTDFGRVLCAADDNGAGWVSESATPMLTGTWVDFKVDFLDVQSLPKPNVINNENYTAYTVFEDVQNPRGFRVFVKDKSGNRVTAQVDWTAMGV